MKTALLVIVVIMLFVGRFMLERHFGETNTILLIFIGFCLIWLLGWLYDQVSSFLGSLRKQLNRGANTELKTSRVERSAVRDQGMAVIARFRKLINDKPSSSTEELVRVDISHLDTAESERLCNWFRSQQSANKEINLGEYAIALAMPLNPSDEEHDDVLLIMNDVFCDHASDLPMSVTGGLTIEETLQDMKDYLQSQLDKA